ncbi:porin family protein [Pedobacter aquatilis]|uniref:porin family protein n=1 Tax=Pedobacter aquatilis TaxID=351343 RepID=UPI0025B4EBBB|nr:porin family protein [Pedobacter aquatilis]MDN3586879.1 porin family protein [Pedobacter aquatilis]
MKKHYMATAFALLTFCAAKSQIVPTVKAGVTFPSISSSQSMDLQDVPNAVDYGMSTSFYVGGTIDFSLSKVMYLQTGAMVVGKGGQNEFFGNKTKIKTFYVEVPVNFLYKLPFGIHKLLLGAGPYVAVAFDGHTKLKSAEGQKYNMDINFVRDFKRTDFGLDFVTGLEFSKHLTFNVGYGLGLLNIRGSGADYITDRNQVLSAGLGYRF